MAFRSLPSRISHLKVVDHYSKCSIHYRWAYHQLFSGSYNLSFNCSYQQKPFYWPA